MSGKFGNYVRNLGEKYLNESSKVEPGELISKEIALTGFADVLFKAANHLDAIARTEVRMKVV